MNLNEEPNGSMSLNEYQEAARVFRSDTADWNYALLNLAGEVGELLGLVAKVIRDGPNEKFRELGIKELGDILWHVSAVADDLGVSLDEVATININKLESRKQRGVLGGSGDER